MRSLFLSVFLMLTSLFLTSCGESSINLKEVSNSDSTVTLGAAPPEDSVITIFHTADIESFWELSSVYGEDKRGGAARIKTLVDSVKTENAVFVDIGDTEMNVWRNTFALNLASQMFALLDYDMVVLGNHEFDKSMDEVDAFVRQLDSFDIPVLASNYLLNTDQGKTLLEDKLVKSRVKTIDGIQYGFIGLIQANVASVSNFQGNVLETAAVQTVIDDLTAQGVDNIIALAHLGDWKHSVEVAESLKGLDLLLVAGTSHYPGVAGVNYPDLPSISNAINSNIPNDNFYQKVGDTYIIHGSGHSLWTLGELNVAFDSEGTIVENKLSLKHHLVEESLEEEMSIKSVLGTYSSIIEDLFQVPIGIENKIELSAAKTVIRSQESLIGNLITDALFAFLNNNNFAVDAAVYNGGGIRADIPVANLNKQDILTTLAFSNVMVIKEMNGKQLHELFNQNYLNISKGGFLSQSGLKVEYNSEGIVSKLCFSSHFSLDEGGEVLFNKDPYACDPNKSEILATDTESVFKIAVSNFIANGGDGYDLLKPIPFTDTGFIDNAIVIEFLEDYFDDKEINEGDIVLQSRYTGL